MRWVERLVHGHGQAAAQLGQAHQQQAQPVLGVHGVVGEQAQVFEHVVAQVLGLVDDEHGVDAWPPGSGGETSAWMAR